MTARDAMIRDLRVLADWLEANPAIPVDEYDRVDLQHSFTVHDGDEAARLAEVERVAALMGAPIDKDARGIRAVRHIGGRVHYKVHANTDLGEAIYDAETSYRGAVEPDRIGAPA